MTLSQNKWHNNTTATLLDTDFIHQNMKIEKKAILMEKGSYNEHLRISKCK